MHHMKLLRLILKSCHLAAGFFAVPVISEGMYHMKLFLRLTVEVNDGLRLLLRYRGDLSRFIEEALGRADLMRLELVRPPKRGTRGTTAVVNKDVVARLGAVAKCRGCSTTVLANSAIFVWLGWRQRNQCGL